MVMMLNAIIENSNEEVSQVVLTIFEIERCVHGFHF